MAPLLFLIISLSLSPVSSSSSLIEQACGASRFPESCTSSLAKSSSVPPDATPTHLILAAISVSVQNLKIAQSMVRAVLDASAGNPNRTNVARDCIETLGYSDRRLARAADVLPLARVKDAGAWGSAALLYQYSCFSSLKYVNGTKHINDTMWFLISLTQLTSNALSMLAAYERFGNDTSAWAPPQTERDDYWGEGAVAGGSSQGGGFPSDLSAANAMVCKEGGKGCYRTVQEAVNAAPGNGTERFVIYIKEGVYIETVRIPFEKTNVVFLGDGMGKSIITGSLKVGMLGVNTYDSATVGVSGDGFMAKGLTIENTAGPDAHQAVAFRSDSDLSVLEEVEFLGHQDTLFVVALRQFYKSCRIAGTVDFIFGNAAAVFQDCLLLVQSRQLSPEKDGTNTVTAHGRTDTAQATGFVFHDCAVNGTADYMALYSQNPVGHRNNYLGRPWKEYSRTVFIRCYLGGLISPEGWMNWTADSALDTLFYGEFESTGPGANPAGRVRWSNQIPAEHVGIYSVQRFIQGGEWIPWIVMAAKNVIADLAKGEKLNGSNYDIWHRKIQYLLDDQDMLDHLTTSKSPPEEDGSDSTQNREAYAAWFKKDRSARFTLLSAMADDLIGEFENYTTAKDMWDHLKFAFGGTSVTRLRALVLKFETYRMDARHTMIEHLRVISTMIRDLKAAGHELTDEQQVQAVIRSLPDSWTQLKQILTHNEGIRTFSDISRHVELEAEREVVHRATAHVAQGSRRFKKYGPQKKGKGQDTAPGPNKDKTFKRHRGKRGGKKDKSRLKCFNCKKRGHFAHECLEPKKEQQST